MLLPLARRTAGPARPACRRLCAALGLLVVLLLCGATPAAASHDDHGPGAVLLLERPGGLDRVVVVFPLGADEQELRRRVLDRAAARGLQLQELRVEENTDPDNLRVLAAARLTERTGLLTRRLPAEGLAAVQSLGDSGAVHLRVSSWTRVDGLPAQAGGEYALTRPQDVTYRTSPWALVVPLLLLGCAAAVPYLLLRLVAARIAAGGRSPEDALHRIQRAVVLVQFAVPIALLAALLGTDTADWPVRLAAELVPGVLPQAAARLLGLLAFLLPFLLALLACGAVLVPYDRRLRGTRQTTRAGLGQYVRWLALALLPVLLWQVLLVFLPAGNGWVLAPAVLLFVLGLAALGPLLTNAVLTTRALDEPLRSRVLERCREQGLRVRDVRLLDSRGGQVGNAAISGILPNLRYVFLTDHLVELLDDDELDAVLAHEIGHGKGHHLLLKLGATLAALAAVAALLALGGQRALASAADAVGLVPVLVALPVLLVLVLLLVQGGVGVALEKRADDAAVAAVGAAPLAAALDKIADANRTQRRTGWLWNVLQQHPGLEPRLRRLHERAGREPGTGSQRAPRPTAPAGPGAAQTPL